MAQLVKNPPAMWETRLRSLGWEDPLEKEMTTHSSILAWRIPWTEEEHHRRAGRAGMKKGGAKIGRKELSPQAHFSWMSERFRNGLPLKAPWLVLDYMAAREARRVDTWQRGMEPSRTT